MDEEIQERSVNIKHSVMQAGSFDDATRPTSEEQSFVTEHEHPQDHVDEASENDRDPLTEDKESYCYLKDQDRFLPIANVARIVKNTLPSTGKVSKDAKECIQECVSEFISFITSEASERCQQEKRKTINGEDILYAMAHLGFDTYVDPLKIFLQKYRENLKGEKLIVNNASIDSQLDDITDIEFGNTALAASLMSADSSIGTTASAATTMVYASSNNSFTPVISSAVEGTFQMQGS